jgi:hypothetical protein
MLYFDHITINRLTDLYLEDNIGARFGSDSVLGLSIREIVLQQLFDNLCVLFCNKSITLFILVHFGVKTKCTKNLKFLYMF